MRAPPAALPCPATRPPTATFLKLTACVMLAGHNDARSRAPHDPLAEAGDAERKTAPLRLPAGRGGAACGPAVRAGLRASQVAGQRAPPSAYSMRAADAIARPRRAASPANVAIPSLHRGIGARDDVQIGDGRESRPFTRPSGA